MIQSSHALVTLKPARQAALQAIMSVEDARQRGTRLPSMPHGCAAVMHRCTRSCMKSVLLSGSPEIASLSGNAGWFPTN